MRKKPASKSVSTVDDDVESLERLLLRLSDKVAGYPYELALASRLAWQLEKRAADVANEVLRPLELSYVLYSTLVIISGGENGSMAPSAIAQLTGEKPTNVTHICNELAERHLITRVHGSAEDRRRISVSITAAGEKLLAKAQPAIWDQWRARFDDFSTSEIKSVVTRLRRQLKNLRHTDAT